MKKIIKLLFVSLLILTLFGCHAKKEAKVFEVPEEFDTSRNYEITFWAKNDNNKNQVNVYQNAIKEFEKLYPNIKVNISLYTDYSKIYNDVITNISTNTTPNVCITYPDHIATYITGQENVVNLEGLINDSKYGLGGTELRFDSPKFEEMVAEFLNEGKINSKQYAIPFMRSTEALYINEDYVEKLGYKVPDILTWDFIWEVSEKAISTLNEDGTYYVNNQNVLIPFIYKSTDNMMIQMLNQLNAGYSDEEGSVLIFNNQTRDILKEVAIHSKSKAFSTFKISSYPANFLNAGQCIFAIDSTAGATWMGSNAPLVDIPEEDLVEFNTLVRPIPQYDTNNISMISQGPSICVFNKKDANEVLASWLFAEFLLTNDIQLGYSKTEGYLPVTTKCINSKEYQDYINSDLNDEEHYRIKLDASKLLMNNIHNTFVTPVFNGSTALRTTAGDLIEQTVKGINRKKEVNDEFIDELFINETSLNRLDQINILSNKKDLGELPKEAKLLLSGICVTACSICVYLITKIKKKNKSSN